MSLRIQISLFIITASLLQSCSRTAYVPSTQNIPMLTEKNDFSGTIAFSYIQGAYAVTDHIAVLLNYEQDGSWKNYIEDDRSRKHLMSLGGGYFNKINDFVILETYGGVGFGAISLDDNLTDPTTVFSARQVQYYLQPSVSVTSQFAEVGFSMKITGLDFYNLNDSQYNFEDFSAEDFDLSLINAPFYTLLEPALTLRTGTEVLKFSIQLQRSIMIEQRPLSRKQSLIVFGINVNLNSKKHFSQHDNMENIY